MTSTQSSWAQLSDRLEALALKFKMHLEQSSSEELPEALGKLRRAVQDAFEATGNAVKDEAVRADVREAGRLFAESMSKTFAKVSDDLRDLFDRKS